MDYLEFVKNVFKGSRILAVGDIGEREVVDVDSTAISEITYNNTSKILTITFTSGASYIYIGVPESEYENLAEASSIGRTFVEDIRNNYFFIKS